MSAEVATIRVRAVPNGRRAEVVGAYGDAWKLRVTAAPERGRANEELVRLLAEVLDVPRASIELVVGAGARDKRFRVSGLRQPDAHARLAAAASR